MKLKEADREELVRLGAMLDECPASLGGETMGVFLAAALLKVRDRRGECAPLIANRVQREYERRRGRQNIVLKARQLGMSSWIAGRFFLKTITRPGTLTVEVAHTRRAAEGIFRIVHRFLESLPEPLRNGVLRTSRSSGSQIVFPELDSEYRVESAGEASAGRGKTIQNLHCSEVAFWPGNAAEALRGLRAGMPVDGELVLESTANGAGGCFFDEWRHAEETGLVRHFFPWWWEDEYRAAPVPAGSLNEEERHLVEAEGLSLEQIGFRRQVRAQFRGLAAQEYAEEAESCFLSSGSCVFEMKSVMARLAEVQEPVERRLNGALEVWFPPVAGRRYVVAVDTAGGGAEGDYSAAEVLDAESGLECAELRAHLGPLETAEQVVRLARDYNGALLVVERNNHGAGVLAFVHSVHRYPRVYEQDGQAGWLTTSLTRQEMVNRLGLALVEQPRIFSSRRLLEECRTFVRQKNGRAEAQCGSHDDLVMAMAMGLAVIQGYGTRV
jgi:hypothetical protein